MPTTPRKIEEWFNDATSPNQRGYRVYEVRANPGETLTAATAFAPMLGVCKINTAWGLGSWLRCDKIDPEEKSRGAVYHFRCEFSVPPAGEKHKERNDNQNLGLPIKRQWYPTPSNEQIDKDSRGHAIVSSVGLPPQTPITKNITKKKLTITVMAENYSLLNLKQYECAVSSQPVTIVEPNGSSITVAAGFLFCESICPQGEYDQYTVSVPIQFCFEVTSVSESETTDPYQVRIFNESKSAWYQVGEGDSAQLLMGPLAYVSYDQNGKELESIEVSDPVPMKLDGTPCDPKIRVKVGKTTYAPAAVSFIPPVDEGVTTETYTDSNGNVIGTWIVWPRYKTADFNNIWYNG